jgi:predicted DNA-binding transcriptional regulator AlpA
VGQLNDDELMGLATFLALTHLSRSGERRHRRETEDWPPHIEIGRKILYRRAAVMDWLESQEAKRVSAR